MGAEIKIRKAVPADIGRVADIENLSFDSDRFSRRQLAYLASKAKGAFFVAETEGMVAGYISLLSHPRRSRLRIYAIAVAPDFRGRNIAGTLISKAKEYAAQGGFSGITLEVRTDNAAATGLYRRHGFERSGLRKGYYADGTDACVMTWQVECNPDRSLNRNLN